MAVDNNRVPTLKCVLNTDGTTVTNIKVVGNSLSYSNGAGGSDNGVPQAERNDRNPVLIGVSATDGITIVEVYCNSSGAILTRTT